MEANPVSFDERSAELAEAVRLIRERVRSRYPSGDASGFSIRLADLMPVLRARDAAQGKVAAIGSVNPRPPGLANRAVQFVKKLLGRSLNWYVREQVEFNRATLACIDAMLEALNEQNRAISQLAGRTSDATAELRSRLETVEQKLAEIDQIKEGEASLDRKVDAIEQNLKALIAQTAKELETGFDVNLKKATDKLSGEAGELKDIRIHWQQWRQDWERKLSVNEIQFLRGLADLQGAFNHRATMMETNFRDIARSQHRDFEGALSRTTVDIQDRLWKDMERIQAEYEKLIHNELRTLRQRAAAQTPATTAPAAAPVASDNGNIPGFDWLRFADRFRGDEAYILRYAERYQEAFRGCRQVLDAGCGRGELLKALDEAGIGARGIDSNEECIRLCRANGVKAEAADLFPYLESVPPGSLDGFCCIQVVEHLPAARLPELVSLAAQALARGGKIAIETPNPECLAIFATHFYLDPTHTRPVPAQLLSYYLEEAGFGLLRVETLSPAEESMSSLGELPADFRKAFFGGLDYVIFAEKL